MTNRRSFLKQAGLLSAGVMVAPHLLSAKPIKNIGLQLYSLRDIIGKDVSGTIAKVAAAGYKEVEPYGYSKKAGFWGLQPKEFSALLKQNGLTTPAAHYDMNQFWDLKKRRTLRLILRQQMLPVKAT
ncbi:hypothetical protein [Mucilaginibacter antarcticus]|uniref:hypothetical protein n=1 Tax=Mucilaginibacter antarcticus TaxID=1855725 RepID=UPI0036355A40